MASSVRFLESAQGDVLYLDPPYPGAVSYEEEYRPLDLLLEGVERERSVYSSGAPPLGRALRRRPSHPRLAHLHGQRGLELGELEVLVRRHRSHVRSSQLAYAHLAPIASRAKNERNREYLVAAT